MLAASVFTLVALEPNHGAGHLAIIAKGKTYHGIAAQLRAWLRNAPTAASVEAIQVSRRERIIASSVKVHAGNCELYNAIGASVDLDSYFAGDKRATVVLTQPRPIRAVNGTARMSTSWTGR